MSNNLGSATENIENNFLYDGKYKEMDCMKEFIKYKNDGNNKKNTDTDVLEKPEAVLCAYDKYIFKSGVRNEDRLRRRAHKNIIVNYCENSSTACKSQDEYGFETKQDEMCLKVNACEDSMSFNDIIPTAVSFFEVFNSVMEEISPQKAHELLKMKNKRSTAYLVEQASIKTIEMGELEKK